MYAKTVCGCNCCCFNFLNILNGTRSSIVLFNLVDLNVRQELAWYKKEMEMYKEEHEKQRQELEEKLQKNEEKLASLEEERVKSLNSEIVHHRKRSEDLRVSLDTLGRLKV